MPSAKEISEQVASETYRRGRLAVPAFAGGFLYLLGGIIASSTLNGAPTVGLLQGLAPAFRGEVNPAVSPRAAEVKFISHHAFPLIAGSVLSAFAVVVLTLVLLLLIDATRFRRPNSWAAARPLVLVGGIGLAVLTIGHQAISSIETHSFAVGHDFSSHAVDHALTKGAVNEVTAYVDLLVGLAIMAGMIGAVLGALRVGLLPRWMGILGCFTGVLIFLPLGGATLEVVPAFWIVMMGIMYVGKWPNGDPPAWAAGEARPWPTQAERRAEYAEERAAKQARKGQPALSTAGADVAPAPAQPASSGRSRKRRRKRGARG
jgi:hypothetical protein